MTFLMEYAGANWKMVRPSLENTAMETDLGLETTRIAKCNSLKFLQSAIGLKTPSLNNIPLKGNNFESESGCLNLLIFTNIYLLFNRIN